MYGQRRYNRSTIDQPQLLLQEASINLDLPSVCWSNDEYSLTSSGMGRGHTPLMAAVGEYFERRHFCCAVKKDRYARLEDVLGPSEVEEWLAALQQTGNAERDQLLRHEFAMTDVRSLGGGLCTRSIPTSTIRILQIPKRDNDDFYRFHDTSGCCVHTSAQQAIIGASFEQLERQCLLLFWLTGWAGREIGTGSIERALVIYAALHRKMNRHGVLRFFDITIPELPGYAILAVYQDSSKSGLIQYCPGLSYALDIESAIRKAFVELWQNYNFLLAFNSAEKADHLVKDRYQRHFLKMNIREIAEEVCARDVPSQYPPRSDVTYSVEQIFDYVSCKFPATYIYLRREGIGCGAVYCCKIVSPGMFLHMDNSRANNIRNRVTEPYFDLLRPDRVSRMVPFP